MNNELNVINACQTCGHQLCARKVSLFSTLNDKQLELVVNLIKRKTIKKNEHILNQGDVLDALYIVNLGRLKTVRFDLEGNEQILNIVNEGDSFGDLALLKQSEISYDLIAMKTGHLCMIPKADFDNLIINHPEIMLSILESAHDRIVKLENHISAIASNNADVRLRFLISSLKGNSEDIFHGQTIHLDLTREEMANYVGVTRETISRKLSKLAKLGLIRFKTKKDIVILKASYFNNSND